MAFMQIPQGAKEMQIGGQWIKIPDGKSEIEIPDELLKPQTAQPTPKPQQNFSAPAAPKWEEPKQKVDKPWYEDVVEFVSDGAKGLGKEIKRTASAMWEDSIFGDYGTGAGEVTKAKVDVAKAQNTQGLLKTLTQSDESKATNDERLAQTYDNLAKQRGYDLGAIVDGDKIYFGKTGENGEIKTIDATPDLTNQIAANKGEIVGAVAGSLLPGGALAKMAKSAVGSGIGAGTDYANRAENLGEQIDTQSLLMRAGEAVVDDLLGGAVVAGGAKALNTGIPQAIAKSSVDLAKKGYDFLPTTLIQRQITTDNIGGAQAHLNKILGGDAQVAKNLATAKNALGDASYNDFSNAQKTIHIPKSGIGIVDKGIEFANEKIIKPIQLNMQKAIQGENISQKEADMLLTSLASDDGAKIILDAIAKDPNAFAKADQTFTKLNQSTKKAIDDEFMDAPNVIEVFKNYEQRTKKDFADVVETLDGAFSKTATADVAKVRANLLNYIQRALPKASTYKKQILQTIFTEQGFKGLNSARNLINSELGKLSKMNDFAAYQQRQLLGSALDAVDGAMDEVFTQYEKANPQIGINAKELMQTAKGEYAKFKELQNSDMFKRLTGSMKDTNDLTNTLIKSSDNQTGLNLDEALSRLNQSERASVESGLFKNIIDKFSKDGMTDYKGAMEVLERLPFKSERVVGTLDHLKQSLPVLKNSSEILSSMRSMVPKTAELSQGIGTQVDSAFKTMARNRVVNKLKSKLPYLGDNQALKNHIANALKNAGDLNVVIKNISEIPAQNLDSATRQGLEKFVNEVVPQIRQIIKESQDEQNFLMKDGSVAKTDYNVKIPINQEVKQNLDIDADKLQADLFNLFDKHPEMFSRPSDVYRAITAIQDNPNRYYKNNRADIALIAKDLQDGKLGKIGIVTQGENIGKIGHLSISSNAEKEKIRLNKRNEANLAVGAPHPTLRSTDLHQGGQKAGADARSPKSDDIIPQSRLKGENFTMGESGATKTDYNVKMELAPNVRDLAKLSSDEISADLEWLANKHPEMFDKPSDVFRLVREIKNDPTHFYNNNKLDYALIVKRLAGDKIGKLAINRASGEIRHASKVDDKDLGRLKRVSDKNQEVGAGIIQTFIQPGSKSKAELGLPKSDDIIPQSRLKGENFTIKEGGTAYNYAKTNFEPQKYINELSGVLNDEWSANLKSLALKHPEMFRSEADVFRVIKQIKDNPTHFFKNNNERNAIVGSELKNGKFGEVAVNKENGEVVHATQIQKDRRIKQLNTRQEKELGNTALVSDRSARLNRHSDTSQTMATAKAGSAANIDDIIPQSRLNELKNNYDIDKFLNDRADISAKEIRYGKTRFSGAQIQTFNKGNGWEREYVPAGYERNYKADFSITKADVAKIRAGIADETLMKKLQDDLELSEHLGYDYKRPNRAREFADDEFFSGRTDGRMFGGHSAAAEIEKQRFSQTGRDANTIMYANPHLGSGIVTGTLNSRDENGNFSPENFIKGFAYGLMGSKAGATALRKLSPKTYNAILGLGEKMPTMAKSNPALLGKIYKNAKDGSINTFAGEKALNAKVNKLLVAKAMAANNTDEVAIWQKTGWFRDEVDGKWKFEINPRGGEIIKKESGKLGEILKDDELFRAYPQLKEINVIKLGDAPNGAMASVKLEKQYILKDGRINQAAVAKQAVPFVKKEYSFENFKADFPDGKARTPIGEINIDARQFSKLKFKERENFLGLIKPTLEKPVFVVDFEDTTFFFKPFRDEKGVIKFASVAKEANGMLGVVSNYPMKDRKFELMVRDGKIRYTQSSAAQSPIEHSLGIENTQSFGDIKSLEHSLSADGIIPQNSTKGYYDPAKNEIALSDMGDKSTLYHEIQHVVQEIEGFAKGGKVDNSKYAKLGGEAEARNVQNRLNLSSNNLKHPLHTLDVVRNERIAK